MGNLVPDYAVINDKLHTTHYFIAGKGNAACPFGRAPLNLILNQVS